MASSMELISKNEGETRKIGKTIAELILRGIFKTNTIILTGKLGSGKTTFLKGFASRISRQLKIISPTFIIIRSFNLKKSPKNQRFKKFYHIDLFRIRKNQEIQALGLSQILSNPENLVAIEWGERLKNLLPANSLQIVFKIISNTKRLIIIKRNCISTKDV